MRVMEKMWAITGAGLLAISMIVFWVWPKFFNDFHPVFGWAEAQAGAAWLDPIGRYVAGAAAAVTVVLLLVPKTRLLGAWAGLGISVAYMVFHMTPWLGVSIPDYDAMARTLQAGGTAADVTALGLKGDNGAHFSIALTNAVLAGIAVVAERGLRKPRPQRAAGLYASA